MRDRPYGRTDPARLRDRGRADVLDALSTLMADMLWPHPFREVNGRTIRTFLTQLSAAGGRQLRWDGLNRDRNRAAARAAHEGDHEPLRAMLDERLLPVPTDGGPSPQRPT